MCIRSFAVPIFLGLVGGVAGMLISAKGAALFWPYSLMQLGMNANKSEDLLSGKIGLFLVSYGIWFAGVLLVSYLFLKKLCFRCGWTDVSIEGQTGSLMTTSSGSRLLFWTNTQEGFHTVLSVKNRSVNITAMAHRKLASTEMRDI